MDAIENESHVSDLQSSRSWALFKHMGRINLLRGVLLATVVILLSLLLSGCTAPTSSLTEIYILSLSYPISPLPPRGNQTLASAFTGQLNDTSKLLQVRVGYFGLCAMTSSSIWMCDCQPSDLVNALKVANQTDPLNLVWVGNQLRTETVSSAFVFITVILACAGLIAGIAYPLSDEIPDTPYNSRVTAFLTHSSTCSLAATRYSISCMSIATASVFTAAIWQHLSSATSAALASNLTFNSIECHTGPVAIAFGWVSFVLTGFSILSLAMEKRSFSDLSRARPEAPGRSSVQHEPHAGEDMAEQPPFVPGGQWQQQQPELAWLQTILYLTGQTNMRFTARQHETAEWVERVGREGMPHGFAETIVDDNQTRE